jgi:YD repeat-containing protein
VDGQVLKQASIDAGDKWSLANVLGAPLRAWDAVGHRTRVELDVLQRPTHVWVKKGSGAEWLATRVYYGESVTSPEDDNLRGKAVLTFDGAGVVETSSFDFKGNALSWSRRLAIAITAEPDWTATDGESTPSAALAAAASLLENETWTKAFAYDALNRVTSATLPDSSELLPSYNEAGLLGGVEV